MKPRLPRILTFFIMGWRLSSMVTFQALGGEAQSSATPSGEAKSGMSAEELNRQLNNPVSSVWSIVFQNNFTEMKNDYEDVPGWDRGETKWFYNLNFQPVLPIPLTKNWNLINRPVFPFYADRPVPQSDGFDETGGMGDIGFVSLLVSRENQRQFSLGRRTDIHLPHIHSRPRWGRESGRPARPRWDFTWERSGSSERSLSSGGPMRETAPANRPARATSSISSGGFCRISGRWAWRRTS